MELTNDTRYVHKFTGLAPGLKGLAEVVKDVFYSNNIAQDIFYKHDAEIICEPTHRSTTTTKGFNLIGLKSGNTQELEKEIDDLADEIEIMEANYGKDNQKRTETLARKTTVKQQLDALQKELDKITGQGENEI